MWSKRYPKVSQGCLPFFFWRAKDGLHSVGDDLDEGFDEAEHGDRVSWLANLVRERLRFFELTADLLQCPQPRCCFFNHLDDLFEGHLSLLRPLRP